MITYLSLCFTLLFSAQLAAQQTPDFGDHSSSTLTTKAWDALGVGDAQLAITYAEKCISMYRSQAVEMQTGLDGFAPTDPPEAASKYWALNDVGTCLFIKGEALMKLGLNDQALAAYKELVDKLGYAQCWDKRGWFWKPAEAAKQKIVELEFDQQ